MSLYDTNGKFIGVQNPTKPQGGLYNAQGQYQGTPKAPQAPQPQGTLKTIGGALISSEQNLAKGITAAYGPKTVTPESAAQAGQTQQQLIEQAHKLPLGGARRTQLLQEANRQAGQTSSQAEQQYKEMPTQLQTAGAIGGTALDILTPGTLAKGAKSFGLVKGATAVAGQVAKKTGIAALKDIGIKTAKSAALGGAIGYGYDVTQNLQAGKTGTEAVKPGMGTALGVSIPAIFGAYQAGKVITAGSKAKLAARIDNSLIKPLPKDFRYGKNPGKTMAEMGITANSEDELISNLRKSKLEIGKQLEETAQSIATSSPKVSGQKLSSGVSYLNPIDDAIKTAASRNDSTLIKRLTEVKKALTENLVPQMDIEGNVTGIKSLGKKDISGFMGELELKRTVGDLTKWTGSPTEDKLVNKALKQVWGKLDESLMGKAKAVSPTLATKFEKLNSRYADLVTAEIATRHTAELSARKDLISMPIKAGGVGGIVAAIVTGGAAIPSILGAVAVGTLEKAMSSIAVKTRVASWLGKESPSVIQKIFEKNPGIRNALYKAFYKENNAIDKKAIEILDNIKEIPGRQGGYIDMSGLTKSFEKETGAGFTTTKLGEFTKQSLADKAHEMGLRAKTPELREKYINMSQEILNPKTSDKRIQYLRDELGRYAGSKRV